MLAGLLAALVVWASPASAAVSHVVVSGESLSSIAAANGISVSSLASYNALADDTLLTVGQTLQVPAVTEVGSTSTTTTSTSTSTGGHVVVYGESLWSIAAANGITVSSLASYNGLSEDALLTVGQTLQVPAATTSTAATSDGVPLGSIDSPYGTLYLRSDAASAWNSMREDSLNNYGVDLYPGGPLSAYRTYDQQAALYQQYLDGTGAPANPPGASEHNLGTAVDLPTEQMRSMVDSIGGAYGWGKISAPDEWWHVSFFGG
jgi:LysM repeat protein